VYEDLKMYNKVIYKFFLQGYKNIENTLIYALFRDIILRFDEIVPIFFTIVKNLFFKEFR